MNHFVKPSCHQQWSPWRQPGLGPRWSSESPSTWPSAWIGLTAVCRHRSWSWHVCIYVACVQKSKAWKFPEIWVANCIANWTLILVLFGVWSGPPWKSFQTAWQSSLIPICLLACCFHVGNCLGKKSAEWSCFLALVMRCSAVARTPACDHLPTGASVCPIARDG